METLIEEQVRDFELVTRAFINLKKKGGQSTRGTIESHLAGLERRWSGIEARHQEILKLKTATHSNIVYFKEDLIGVATTTFFDERGKFLDALHSFDPPTSAVPVQSSSALPAGKEHRKSRRKLPPIDISPFSGKYSDWTSFKDYFTALVANDRELENVEKLHYLKAYLKGDASNLIKNIPVTADNYERAWRKLTSHYDNKRNLLQQCLDTFLQIKPMATESPQALKRLRDGASETVETLEILGRPADNDFLVHLTIQRFDAVTRRDWELSLGNSPNLLTWKNLDDFMKARIQALERAYCLEFTTTSRGKNNSGKNSSSNFGKVASHATSKSASASCSFCQAEHFIASCNKFRACTVSNRNNFIKDKRLCFNCLGPHRLSDCRSMKTCFTCRERHHTLLHQAQLSTAPPPLTSGSTGESPSNETTSHTTRTQPSSQHLILLATARLTVSSDQDRKLSIRALIDPCSEASFITESLAQQLRLPRLSVFVPISGVGAASCSTAKSVATANIAPWFESDETWRIQALILPKLTEYLPPQRLHKSSLEFIEGVRLADPQLESLDAIDMIIGADIYPRIINENLRKSATGDIIAQSTGLGWIITGSTQPLKLGNEARPGPPLTSLQCIVDRNLSFSLERFWIQEESVVKTPIPLTADETECENHFASTHQRTPEGRYMLRLPLKSNITQLGNSDHAARSALLRAEKSFTNQQPFYAKYTQFMNDYLTSGHMKMASVNESLDQQPGSFFLPHHGVFKARGDTSKLRVVFNGSVKLRDGLAINDCLHTGPKLQADIFDILLRWRAHRYVFSADIKQMFRQILIHPEDQRYQQILWRDNPDQSMQTYSLCTVTYGLASSPYQAIRTLRQLASDERERFPRAVKLLYDNIYVDDILAGADSLDQVETLKTELTELLMAGGFPLSKWTSNHTSVLSQVPADQRASLRHLTWQQSEAVSMLGISWLPSNDAFYFQFEDPHESGVTTKRKALSLIAQLYDPLGWITPIVVRFKIFMQKLWHAGIQWDDALPLSLQRYWNHLYDQLRSLHEFSVPRWIGLSKGNGRIELHGFSDASERAYAACLYVRTFDNEENVSSILLAAKSKVAPLQQVSLPRLELSGALLLVRLTKRVQETLNLQDIDCHMWTDSTITLSWIREHPSVWKTYVANRVSEIQTTLSSAYWHHVAGKENPADCASRGVSPQELIDSPLWLHGPAFLRTTATPWNNEEDYGEPQENHLDRRSQTCAATVTSPSEPQFLLDVSCLDRLLRRTSRCIEFIQKLRFRKIRATVGTEPRVQVLTPEHLDSALKLWIVRVQTLFFKKEIKPLSQDKPILSKSSLLSLHPFLDNHGLLRVGGRLRHSCLNPDERHPMILPRESHLSRLIIENAHRKTLHGGTQLTLSYVRQQFWIIRGRQLVKSIILKCFRCWRFRATPNKQLMGDLPPSRVQQHRPFLHMGIDYAGPIFLRLSKGRGTRSYKGYIAVFVCLSTHAVHLEVASGYSTPDFLNVYRRVVARRGIPATITTDCGTNFVGADKDLRDLFHKASKKSTEIAELLAKDGTEWKFNPPAAPHFGGIWEAAVKSVKSHLKRLIGETLLTFEEMSTLLAQIEACLNSRPLCPLTDDPTDTRALTPGDFLIGQPTLTVPEPTTLDNSTSRLQRWQLLRQMYEKFWNRWATEYLHNLQQRSKWRIQQVQPKVGDLCLLRLEQHPPCKWPLARITDVRPGADGLVRVVQLRTTSTTLTRPITKISVLPSEDNYSPVSGEGGRNVQD